MNCYLKGHMLLKDVEIIHREIPEHTYWLIKCIELKYAKDFIEHGSMRFANPSEWCKPDGTSRGDIREGTYASQRGIDPEMDKFLRTLRNNVSKIEDRGFTFYKSEEILSYRVYCLYGLSSNNLHMREVRSQDHRFHRVGIVTKEYFQNIFPRVKQEEVDDLEENKRPAALLIRPDKFMAYVKNKLLEKGVREEEILIGPVSYRDYYKKPFVIGKEPEELFYKHNDIIYRGQSEIRIVIDPRRKEVSELFDEKGVIELGAVDESVATISDYYFKDMQVEIWDNHITYELPRPIEYEIVDVGETYIKLMCRALCDDLHESPMSIEEIESEIDKCMTVIQGEDAKAFYDRYTCMLYYKGSMIDLGGVASDRMLDHYNNYIIEGDLKSAGDTIAKFKHFFPKYDIGDYFSAYYRAIHSHL